MTTSTSHFYKNEMENIKQRNPSQDFFQKFWDINTFICQPRVEFCSSEEFLAVLLNEI